MEHREVKPVESKIRLSNTKHKTMKQEAASSFIKRM